MQGILIKTDGSEVIVEPENGKRFTLEELQFFVGGTIDVQIIPDGRAIYLNDNGKNEGLEVNEKASRIWQEAYPIEQYPFNNDGTIVGEVLILSKEDEEAMNVCEECGGTGEISTDEDDGEGHTMRGVGTRPCPLCKHKEPTEDRLPED
jgi:hypothetical protein